MEILLTNVGQDPIEIDAEDWSLKRYRDAHRASEFQIKCSRRVPITKYAPIQVIESGKTIFRGYIQKPKIKNIRERELNCRGEEDLLMRRFTGRYSFSADARNLVHAFQSDAPNQVADSYGVLQNVGLLFTANSMIPYHGNVLTTGTPAYDWFALGYDWIYYLAGLGSASRIGTNAEIYAEGLHLPRMSTFAELEATEISCWSDESDLYVRVDDTDYNTGFGPRKMMAAENAYDTGVRMGTIDTPETILTGNLQLNFDRILDILIDLAEFYGLEPQFRYEADHTYLDALLNPTEDEFVLPEEQIRDISQTVASDLGPFALIGKGVGSKDVQHVYTPADHTWKGTWYEETYDLEEGFIDSMGNLKPAIDAEYARLQNDEIFNVKPLPSWPYAPRPNDLILLKLNGEAERSLQVASMTQRAKGEIELEIGGRKDDIVDAFQAKSSLSRVYYQEYLVPSMTPLVMTGACRMGDITHGWCGGLTFSGATLIVPATVKKDDWSHRVTLDVSITSDYPPESMEASVQINGLSNLYCEPCHYMLGDSITKLDITRYVYYGAPSNTFAIWLRKKGEWVGAACINHPTAAITMTVNAWQRTLLA